MCCKQIGAYEITRKMAHIRARSHVKQFANWHETLYFSIQKRLTYVVKPLILCEVILSEIMIGVDSCLFKSIYNTITSNIMID